jgi:hypothetical protein
MASGRQPVHMDAAGGQPLQIRPGIQQGDVHFPALPTLLGSQIGQLALGAAAEQAGDAVQNPIWFHIR